MNNSPLAKGVQKQVFTGTGRRWIQRASALGVALLTGAGLWLAPVTAAAEGRYRKLDPELSRRADVGGARRTSVVVRLEKGAPLPASLQPYVRGGRIDLIDEIGRAHV